MRGDGVEEQQLTWVGIVPDPLPQAVAELVDGIIE